MIAMRGAWILLAMGCGSPTAAPPDASGSDVEGEDVVTGLEAPFGLALDATHVYFAHGRGDVARVARSGGAVEPIASGQRGPASLDASTERLCWVNTGTHAADFRDGSVRCAPKAGGGDAELSASYFPSSLAIDGETVFWVEIDGEAVRSIGLDGGGGETLDTSPTSKLAITATASHLAWTASGALADVVVMARETGAKTTISTEEYAPGALVLDGEVVYWVVQRSSAEGGGGAIRVGRTGEAPADLAPDELHPRNLVRIGDALYWASHQHVRSIPLAGGVARTVVSGQTTIAGLVTDGVELYWSEPDRGAIVRARP
jgi:hypothetical protein